MRLLRLTLCLLFVVPSFTPLPARAAVDSCTAERQKPRPPDTPENNRLLGKRMLPQCWGWGDDQFACLDQLMSRESGWRVNARNARSGAYGIPQALPGRKMSVHGADWQTNADVQLSWTGEYLRSRYGDPCGGWRHFQRRHWY